MASKRFSVIKKHFATAKLISSGWFNPTKSQIKQNIARINRELGSVKDRLKAAKKSLAHVKVVTKDGSTTIYVNSKSKGDLINIKDEFGTVIKEPEIREYGKLATDSALAAIGIKKDGKNEELFIKLYSLSDKMGSINLYSSSVEMGNRIHDVSVQLIPLIGKNKLRFFTRRYNTLIKQYGKYAPELIFESTGQQ